MSRSQILLELDYKESEQLIPCFEKLKSLKHSKHLKVTTAYLSSDQSFWLMSKSNSDDVISGAYMPLVDEWAAIHVMTFWYRWSKRAKGVERTVTYHVPT